MQWVSERTTAMSLDLHENVDSYSESKPDIC